MPLRKSALPAPKLGRAALKSSVRDGKGPATDRMQAQALTLKLYVSAGAPNSLRAIANLEALCRKHAIGHGSIEIVDVFQDPKRALEASVLLTPTLVKVSPGQPVTILGNLSDTETVLSALGLKET